MNEEERPFKFVDRREDPEREAEKKMDNKREKETVEQIKVGQEALERAKTELMKCPNCKWRKKARRFLQVGIKDFPPMIACPNCGSLFLHVDYVKGVLSVLAEKEKRAEAHGVK